MARSLTGMRVLITGASAGIGKALAQGLAAQGAQLVLAARRLDRLEALCRELGPRHRAVACDVADPAQCGALVAAAHAHLGGIDTLVCNAGYGLVGDIAQTSIAQWEAILRTNLLGTTACIAAAVPLMVAQPLCAGYRGQVMIVSSALARRGKPGAGAYCATKAAQLSVAEALRLELDRSHVAVTSVHPVNTATEFDQAVASHGPAWRRGARDPVQSAERVATLMIRAIRRPRRELWPHRPARHLLALAAWWPGLADWALRRQLPP